MEVLLPGGLKRNGTIERNARFRLLTGRIEQALIESSKYTDRSSYVTAVLSHALDRIGEMSADAATVSHLSIADRQYLMLRLGAMLNGEQLWLKVDCMYCHAVFDVEFRRCDLPIKKAGDGYPTAKLQLNNCIVEVGVPTGQDLKGVGELSDSEAMRVLLRRCVLSVNGQPPAEKFFEQLSDDDIENIDIVLDEVSPAVCDRLVVNCPECCKEQYAQLDHYSHLGLDEYLLYSEIHTLASHYHWSEADILDLPQAKRSRYLGMISRTSGSYTTG